MSVSSVIHSTSLAQAEIKYPLPDYLKKAVHYFATMHVIFRNIKFALILKQNHEAQNEGNPFVYGTALNVMAQLTDSTAAALKICLIAKCVNDIVNQYAELYKSYSNLLDALGDRYPVYYPNEMDPSKNHQVLSPALIKILQQEIFSLPSKIVRIATCICFLFWELFKLSMCLYDAKLLGDGDPAQNSHACTELVAGWQRYGRRLKDPRILKQEMNINIVLANKILTTIHSNATASILIDNINLSIEKIKNTELVIDISATAKETTKELLGNGNSTFTTNYNSDAPNAECLSKRYPHWAGQQIAPIKTIKSDLRMTSSPLGYSSMVKFIMSIF